jgi:hypothetical protein
MDGVVYSYTFHAADPAATDSSEPLDAETQRYCAETYPTLKKVCGLKPLERRDAIVREFISLLATRLDEADRRSELVALGGGEVLDFSEFWSKDGDEVPVEQRATAFLERMLSVAKGLHV